MFDNCRGRRKKYKQDIVLGDKGCVNKGRIYKAVIGPMPCEANVRERNRLGWAGVGELFFACLKVN